VTTTIAILGAGGKMGFRITRKLVDAGYDVRAIDVGEAGRQRLTEAGIPATASTAEGLDGAKVVILAIPDSIIGRVAHDIAPQLAPATMLLILDAAAPYAGVLPTDRPDLTYFIGHPCHPPVFNDETDPAARTDYHGGVAKQAIVCALMQGPEEDYPLGEEICKVMWSPVTRSHRVTTEQLAILEPGLSEMIALPFIDVMAEAVEECARLGVPREAAFDFMVGHINVELAMWFGYSPKVPSDAALRLLAYAKPLVVKENWREALSPKVVKEASELIIRG